MNAIAILLQLTITGVKQQAKPLAFYSSLFSRSVPSSQTITVGLDQGDTLLAKQPSIVSRQRQFQSRIFAMLKQTMNVYIEGLGYSEDENTQIAMRVIKSAAIMIGCKLKKLGCAPMEATEFLNKYFDAVIDQHGPQALGNIERVFNALQQYETRYIPQVSNDWPSSKQLKDHFEAYQTDGKLGLFRAVMENNKIG